MNRLLASASAVLVSLAACSSEPPPEPQVETETVFVPVPVQQPEEAWTVAPRATPLPVRTVVIEGRTPELPACVVARDGDACSNSILEPPEIKGDGLGDW